MKIKNYTLISMMNTLQNYSSKKLPQKISYAITRNLMQFSKEYEVYDAQLNKIFETYSDRMVKDEEGNAKTNQNGIPMVGDEVSEEYMEQISDLLNIEIDLDIHYVDSEIFDYDDRGIYDSMSAQDIMVLMSILCNNKSK